MFFVYFYWFIYICIFQLDLPCRSPSVSLPNLSPDVSSARDIHRSSQFVIQSNVSLDCELSHRTTFIWNIYQINAEEIPVLSRNSSSELRITPHLLRISVYLVRLTVNMLETPVLGVGHGYFKVISSPLVAIIAGGSKVARGFNRTLVFNATMSFDPDEENQNLLRKWFKLFYDFQKRSDNICSKLVHDVNAWHWRLTIFGIDHSTYCGLFGIYKWDNDLSIGGME